AVGPLATRRGLPLAGAAATGEPRLVPDALRRDLRPSGAGGTLPHRPGADAARHRRQSRQRSHRRATRLPRDRAGPRALAALELLPHAGLGLEPLELGLEPRE